jgi:adenylate cyclase
MADWRLPRIEDFDAAVLLRAEGEAVARAKFFLEMGVDADETVAVVRVMMVGLAQVAAVMREAAMKTVLWAGTSEIQFAQASEELVQRSLSQVGPMLQDLLLLELRNSFEVAAVNAAERAAGKLPGGRQVAVAFADLTGFTRLGEAVLPEDLERVPSQLAELAHYVTGPPVRFVKSIGDG